MKEFTFIAFTKKLCFLSLISKKRKVALTLLYYVIREILNIKEACLHRPIKILHFPTPARIQKCLTSPENILAF